MKTMQKPMVKRSLALILAILMLFPLFVACKKGDKPVELPIVADGASDYVIVYSSDTDEERTAATKLYTEIKSATGVNMQRKDAAASKTFDETAKEILIGTTNRPESKSAIDALRAKDFSITFQNGRVIITGGCPEATTRAVDYFIANYINKDSKTVTFFENAPVLSQYSYALGALSINGVALTEYRIVYPTGAEKNDLLTYYVAVNLADYILKNSGVEIEVVPDSVTATTYELLVGNTSRTEDDAAAAVELGENQYILCTSGTKVVLAGDTYLVGGAASELVNTHFKSQGANVAVNATGIATTPEVKTFSFLKATSAILMIGDGMGENHIKWTEHDNKIDHFVAFDLPYQSKATTISQSVIDGEERDEPGETGSVYTFTDSAAAATALATGYKTINGYLGMDADQVSRKNIRELAQESGARTAVLTNDVITGATPSGFLCHLNNRTNSTVLQGQIDDLLEAGKIDYAYGAGGQYEIIDETREALSLISENDSSFFIMIEEAHIDKRSHYADKNSMQDAVKRYNEIIAYAIGFVMLHPDTALIITADHETGKLTPDGNGSFTWESYDRQNGGKDYYEHTDIQAPVFGLGQGVGELLANEIDNTDIPKFIASIFGATTFGQ